MDSYKYQRINITYLIEKQKAKSFGMDQQSQFPNPC